jgi:hypothetical protein
MIKSPRIENNPLFQGWAIDFSNIFIPPSFFFKEFFEIEYHQPSLANRNEEIMKKF